MLQSSIVINSLFKTIEYKLLSSNNLELNVLSKSGSLHSKTISLNSINVQEGKTTPSYLPGLVLILGCISIAAIIYVSRGSPIINNNLISIISFLVCIFGSLGIHCTPTKSLKYIDSFSNNVLFEFNDSSIKNSVTSEFIKNLNSSIDEAKQVETDRSSLTSNSQIQYAIHSENVDVLFNSGLIDEILYNRIRNSMNDRFHGTYSENHLSDNVIYLKR